SSRKGLYFDWLRPLHARCRAGRARAGRPLVVGAGRQKRMWPSQPERCQRSCAGDTCWPDRHDSKGRQFRWNLTMVDPLYVASGFGVGFLVGMTGVGGGSLMTPLLILLFGLDARVAVGTDLLYASLTKAAGSVVHGSSGTIDWRVTGRL